MFEKKKAVFIYCVSPVHMGAGSAIGVIDNPIQREKHTGYPMIAGAGLKGAIRHHFWAQASGDGKKAKEMIDRVFGPEPDASSDHAGAVSFTDAQIVAFPVRCARRAFVYATSPIILARTLRSLDIGGCGLNLENWELPTVETGTCMVADEGLLVDSRLFLEAYDFQAEKNEKLEDIAKWISQRALPEHAAYKPFVDKLKSDLVMLSDEDFTYFVTNATIVEPHVRINDVTGTAEDKGLFYTENLPPETVLLSLVMTSRERRERKGDRAYDANEMLEAVLDGRTETPSEKTFSGIDGQLVQIGGDATTGRGQVVFRAVSDKEV